MIFQQYVNINIEYLKRFLVIQNFSTALRIGGFSFTLMGY